MTERKPVVISGPLPGQAVEAYLREHGHLSNEDPKDCIICLRTQVAELEKEQTETDDGVATLTAKWMKSLEDHAQTEAQLRTAREDALNEAADAFPYTSQTKAWVKAWLRDRAKSEPPQRETSP